MVAVPDYSLDPTLEAVHRAVENIENTKPKRTYLGASILGHQCERFIYYQLNFAEKSEPISFKGLYCIEDGHRTEHLIKDRLRLLPNIELFDIDPETNQQIGFMEDRFGGHVDGIIRGLLQAPKTWHIFEAKCCNEKKFNELQKCKDKYGEKSALEQWDFIYYVQAQIYCGKMELDRHYLVCATPGGRDMISCRTEFNKSFYESMLHKKDRILKAQDPPTRISERKEFYVCCWCSFKDFCWKE